MRGSRAVALHPSDDGQPTGRHWRRQDKVQNWPALARPSPPAPLHFPAEPEASEAWERPPQTQAPGWPCCRLTFDHSHLPSQSCWPGRLFQFGHSVNRGVVSERFKQSFPVPPSVPSCGLCVGRNQVNGERRACLGWGSPKWGPRPQRKHA